MRQDEMRIRARCDAEIRARRPPGFGTATSRPARGRRRTAGTSIAPGRFVSSVVRPGASVLGRQFGRYETTRSLGSCGVTELYRARPVGGGPDVALQRLPPEWG